MAFVSYWRKYVQEILVNSLGGLSLPRKSVVRLTDRPDMTFDVYHGRKTTHQQQQQLVVVIQILSYRFLRQFMFRRYQILTVCIFVFVF